tara:strand:+ start:740 stop:1186 length:447 start_codon:yes stop_codon:yes gene_type:complete
MINEEKYRVSKAFLRRVDGMDFSWKDDGSRETKIDLLRKFGYDVLKGKGKSLVKLDDCSTSRLTGALWNTYIAESNKVTDFEGYVKCSKRYEAISNLFESEKDLEGDNLEDAMERTSIPLNDASNMELELLGREFNVDLSGFYNERVA